ncbi:hypothetical protein Pcinc_006918 [Petrolisthes cinctipes]|uniref:Uncharacterized protein n=1 Tax=Petrolisthes cinctipes TaxID=88211 RepID=A0AAE1KZ23_PETCI|nr:hypothetical protein Pcinc_006918 [Petrolisthes cinctipes]
MAGSFVMRAVTLGLCGGGYGLAASIYNLVMVDQLGLAMINPMLSITSLVMGLLYLVLGPITGYLENGQVLCGCGSFDEVDTHTLPYLVTNFN